MKKKNTPKKAAKKATPKKKTAAKKIAKKATKKVAKKAVAKKAVTKKVVKKATKTNPAKAAKKTTTSAKKATKKTVAKKADPEKTRPSQARILLARKNRAQTPAFVRVRTRKNTPIVFSLEEVHGILEKRKDEPTKKGAAKAASAKKTTAKKVTKKTAASKKKRVLGAASLTDILGFNPQKAKDRKTLDESRVPKKFLPHYRNLIKLRDHVQEGLDLHTKETLKRSAKDDAGDLSSYSQHMADAGTDTFDRDFALSMVSNEQDLLYEIEEAIQRIFDGSYGICLNTGKPIPRERLIAVPFTRYSLEGQREQERFKHKKAERGGIFGDISGEDAALYGDEVADE